MGLSTSRFMDKENLPNMLAMNHRPIIHVASPTMHHRVRHLVLHQGRVQCEGARLGRPRPRKARTRCRRSTAYLLERVKSFGKQESVGRKLPTQVARRVLRLPLHQGRAQADVKLPPVFRSSRREKQDMNPQSRKRGCRSTDEPTVIRQALTAGPCRPTTAGGETSQQQQQQSFHNQSQAELFSQMTP